MIGQNIQMLMLESFHGDPGNMEPGGSLSGKVGAHDKNIIGIGREVEGKHKDGTVFPIDLTISMVQLHGKRLFTRTVRDITERKEMQKKIIQQESLAQLGEMASIVAHEVKNPLAGVSGALVCSRGGARALT